MPRRKNRLDDNYVHPAYDLPEWSQVDPDWAGFDQNMIPGGGDRWSTWDLPQASERGPEPYPDWLVTELAAVDTELGVLKTGKEADVFLLRRGVPDTERSCLLAAKRYRDEQHRQFHRSAVYQEGRRTKRTRDARAMQNRSAYGKQLMAGHWARAEFDALVLLQQLGAAVPYPVQILGTEILLEFVGSPDGTAAPRLSEWPGRGGERAGLWGQAVVLMVVRAGAGYAHGDLSAFNLLVHEHRLVMIDLPQLVDLIANPQGPSFLDRDASTVAGWFARHGHPVDTADLIARLHREARIP